VRHLAWALPKIAEEYPHSTAEQREAVLRQFERRVRALHTVPEAYDRIDVLTFCDIRRECLDAAGFPDPFASLIRRANQGAMKALPGALAELDALPVDRQVEWLIRGLLAGNMFDLGSDVTIARYEDGGLEDFRRVREALPARPWLRDDLDAFAQRWARGGRGAGAGGPTAARGADVSASPPYRHMAIFADNAGHETCLGYLPLARWAASRGARVTLAANSGPTLNDITASELKGLFEQAARMDGTVNSLWQRGQVRVVASGNATPLIDLSRLSDECVEAIADADLIVLVGMGRSIESNWSTGFTCDALRIARVKLDVIAQRIGAGMFDCIVRLDPAGSGGLPSGTRGHGGPGH
jgi:type II pantothenate kinase